MNEKEIESLTREEKEKYIFGSPFSNNQDKKNKVTFIKSNNEKEKYPLCNICGKHADWLVVFNDRKSKKEYATTRCHEHARTPEPNLNNLLPYDRRPLWYGSWCFSADEGRYSSLGIISRVKIRSLLSSNITLLSNLFEKEDE